MNDVAELRARFERALAERLGDVDASQVLVAFSGGLDSCVLLHLLRFGTGPRPDILVAHFDHDMRPDSAADAEWVRGLCGAWGLEATIGRAAAVPTSEDAAREARYGFLEEVRAAAGSPWLLTAHHADDQAETVLFRVLRGTGIEGLSGIPASREPSIARPLLDFWREDLEAYARSVRLSWRDDATNADLGHARNALRRSVLPLAEAQVAAGARRSLVRLARIARENEDAWAAVLPDIITRLDVAHGDRRAEGEPILSWDHAAACALPASLRSRVLRHLAARAGTTLDEAGTRAGVEFITAARSGTGIDIGGGIELRRELERLVLTAGAATQSDVPVRIPEPGTGRGEAVLGGRPVSVSWGESGTGDEGDEGVFPTVELEFPLLVRGRAAGDRIRLAGGSRTLKKLLLDARIPSGRRAQTPVLVDDTGRVLWVPGVARASDVVPGDARGADGGGLFRIRIG